MLILKAGILYFVPVFGTGFVLGTIRTLWIVPRLGTRMGELMETPIMLVITILAAQWIVRRLAVPSEVPARLGWGASRSPSCSCQNSGLCSGSGVCRLGSILPAETPSQERSIM
jgi:hypothetical protein